MELCVLIGLSSELSVLHYYTCIFSISITVLNDTLFLELTMTIANNYQ